MHSRWNQAQRHFYPRSPCGERRICFSGTPHSPAISIHALLAESDPGLACFCVPRCVFLSTLSLRRATCSQVKILRFTVISIHALLAESDAVSLMVLEVPLVISIHALLAESDLVFDCAIRVFAHISIHALLAESDGYGTFQKCVSLLFLSTLSLRRATVPLCDQAPCKADFYPRSPCGERRQPPTNEQVAVVFLSTLSLRRATR